MVRVIFAVLIAVQAFTQIFPQTIAIAKATAAAEEMFTVIDRSSHIDSLSSDGQVIPDFQGNICLRGVRFAYPSRADVPVLHGLDLDIPANKQTALVGASGSGKSTIFGLLERWYSPEAGEITLDGVRLEDLNLRWLRTRIRLVQQEPTLFRGTIYQNVVDGLTGTDMADLDDEEKRKLVIEACKSAYAHDFIEELPNVCFRWITRSFLQMSNTQQGYQTFIGERGASLSGGQKQRIVIARSIISNPKVLLLDEATSALDPNAEKIVQKALNNVAKGRTMIVIAHRLSTIRDVDNIIVMAKGETIEQGTHAELVEKNGTYARLVKTQDLGGDDEENHGKETGQDAQGEELDPVITQGDNSAGPEGDVLKKDDMNILVAIYQVFREQPRLWKYIPVIFITSLVGGKFISVENHVVQDRLADHGF